jgi:HK97 family phage portal protein
VGLISGPRPGQRAARAGGLWGITGPGDLIPRREIARPRGGPISDQNTALTNSAVWAALRLRSDLISTFPLDVFRQVGQFQVECPKPAVLVNPAGRPMGRGETGLPEWLYSSQMDLDRAGNAIGLITARDGFGFPAVIELAPITDCAVLVRKGALWKYRICGTLYDPGDVWHERAYTIGGCWVGLSPVAYAAWAIGEYASVQQFAMNWFGSGAVPAARLKNTKKELAPGEGDLIKESWRASVALGEPFVHGADWDYEMMAAQSASADWLAAKAYGITDIARFFGVPSDMIDAAPTGTTRPMTYANISQRNLQLLIMNLGPAIIRREAALSTLTPAPRTVKLNTDALLRLDPLARAQAIWTSIQSRTMTITEARALENRPPLTQADIDEFLTFWPPKGGGDAGPAAVTPPEGAAPGIEPGGDVPALTSGS